MVFTDGPYVETKEFLGGFAVVDVADDEAARMWAGKVRRRAAGPRRSAASGTSPRLSQAPPVGDDGVSTSSASPTPALTSTTRCTSSPASDGPALDAGVAAAVAETAVLIEVHAVALLEAVAGVGVPRHDDISQRSEKRSVGEEPHEPVEVVIVVIRAAVGTADDGER